MRTADGKEFHPKRQQRMEADERVVLSLPGGGGYGEPSEREPDHVARDVSNGLVSVDRARKIYGVVVKEDGLGSCVSDSEATTSPRAASRPEERPGEQEG